MKGVLQSVLQCQSSYVTRKSFFFIAGPLILSTRLSRLFEVLVFRFTFRKSVISKCPSRSIMYKSWSIKALSGKAVVRNGMCQVLPLKFSRPLFYLYKVTSNKLKVFKIFLTCMFSGQIFVTLFCTISWIYLRRTIM